MRKITKIIFIFSILFIIILVKSNENNNIGAVSIQSKSEISINDDNVIDITQEYIEYEQPLIVNGIIVVNKEYLLPKDYRAPKALENKALESVNRMIKDALDEGIILNIRSGYRSYDTQKELYYDYVNKDGYEAANRYSAKPGHSEHQTGLAFDFTTDDMTKSIGSWFDNTVQAKWLYENAYKYGFIIRYPKGKEDITGYKYESWHYRYVGNYHSKSFKMNDLTLEEYLKLDEIKKDR